MNIDIKEITTKKIFPIKPFEKGTSRMFIEAAKSGNLIKI